MFLLQAGMQHYFSDGIWSVPMSVSTGLYWPTQGLSFHSPTSINSISARRNIIICSLFSNLS